MNNYEALKSNLIPPHILNELLNVYKWIGKNEDIEEKLGDTAQQIMEKNLEKEVEFLCKYLNLKVSDNRMRLLITKGSNSLNKEEQAVTSIKDVLRTIINDAKEFPFNGSDLLQYLNKIFGKNSTKFTTRIYNELLVGEFDPKKTSIRAMLENMLNEYHKNLQNKSYEAIYLSMVTYLQMDIMRPYDNHSDFGCLLALYYMMLKSGCICFKYFGFFEGILSDEASWNELKKLCYVNFPTSPIQVNVIMKKVLTMIEENYQKLSDILKHKVYEKRMFKSDGLEQTILRMPYTFTKEDVRKYHPNVSESTLNRALFKLRDEKVIMPLGKGRSARWVKLISDDDPRVLFGGNYENRD